MYSVNKHDIIFRDLNFRIDLSNFDVILLCYEADTLAARSDAEGQPWHRLLSRYFEPQISFPPTFKYMSTPISLTKKQRAPALCNSILNSGNEVYAHAYGRTELLYSDHRPVYTTFELRVKAAVPKQAKFHYAGYEDPSATVKWKYEGVLL